MTTTESLSNAVESDDTLSLAVQVIKSPTGEYLASLTSRTESSAKILWEHVGVRLKVDPIFSKVIPQEDQWHFDEYTCLEKTLGDQREDVSYDRTQESSVGEMAFKDLPLSVRARLTAGYIESGAMSCGLSSVRLIGWQTVLPNDDAVWHGGNLARLYLDTQFQTIILTLNEKPSKAAGCLPSAKL